MIAALLVSLANIIIIAYRLYEKVLLAAIILSWLEAFGIINTRNQIVEKVSEIIHKLTDKFFDFFRRYVPPIGNLDLSPILGFFVLHFIVSFVVRTLYGLANQL
ncbi:MAG: YggT family protein [Alphaproteobacteria bacterium]|nr:YggT family protein [Alphaproteobacteria bacterium]